MTQLKNLSSDCELGQLKNLPIIDIVVIGVIDNSLRERMFREPNFTVEKAIALGQFSEQMKIQAKELKEEKELYRTNFNKKENRYLQPKKR